MEIANQGCHDAHPVELFPDGRNGARCFRSVDCDAHQF